MPQDGPHAPSRSPPRCPRWPQHRPRLTSSTPRYPQPAQDPSKTRKPSFSLGFSTFFTRQGGGHKPYPLLRLLWKTILPELNPVLLRAAGVFHERFLSARAYMNKSDERLRPPETQSADSLECELYSSYFMYVYIYIYIHMVCMFMYIWFVCMFVVCL